MALNIMYIFYTSVDNKLSDITCIYGKRQQYNGNKRKQQCYHVWLAATIELQITV